MTFFESVGHRWEVWGFIAILFVTYCQQSISNSSYVASDCCFTTMFLYIRILTCRGLPKFRFRFRRQSNNNNCSFGVACFRCKDTSYRLRSLLTNTRHTSKSLLLFLHCAVAAAQCIVIDPVCGFVCLFVCVCVCGSVTTITRNCVHRSSPNWVCRQRWWPSPAG